MWMQNNYYGRLSQWGQYQLFVPLVHAPQNLGLVTMFNMGVGGLTLPTPPPSTRGEICSCNSAIWGQGKLMSYNIWGDGQGREGGADPLRPGR